MSSIPRNNNNYPSLDHLESLIAELSAITPPPDNLTKANHLVPNSGVWVLVSLGGGAYAVRAQYTNSESGLKEIYATDDEMKGTRLTLQSALKFCLKMATCSRQEWYRV